eukprot:84104_1
MSKLFKFLTKRIAIKCNRSMNFISYRSYGRLPLSMRSLPIITRIQQQQSFNNAVRRRFYSSNLSDLSERLRTGQITKAEVQRLILSQQQQQPTNNKTITSMNDRLKPMSSSSSSTSSDGKITAMNSSALQPTIQTIGSKGNPLYMKRQTSFKEFIFSLFPFLFILWMLGGFDMVRSRNKG